MLTLMRGDALLLPSFIFSYQCFLNLTSASAPLHPSVLISLVNKQADGGVTAIHMAALNGHSETVELLLDLGACISEVTVEDGTTIDLIGKLIC